MNEKSIRHGVVGMKLAAGEVVLTASGRRTSPFPRFDFDTDRKGTNTQRRVDQWLMTNALEEAVARGDKLNRRQFEAIQHKPSAADKDSAELYLFDGVVELAAIEMLVGSRNAQTGSEGGQ